MRIAVVTTSWPSPGDPAGHFVRAEARALERAGHEVIVVKPPTGGAFGWPGVAARIRERPARVVDAARWTAASRARLRAMSVDGVVAHWAVPCAFPIGTARGGPWLDVVSHGADVRLLIALPSALRGAIVRAIALRAERWRFVSEPLLQSLLDRIDRAAAMRVERIAVVQPAALEMHDVREAAALLRHRAGPSRLAVSVGRLVPSKRVDRAIEYVAHSAGAWMLVVVGDGPERARLERLAVARGVDARFVGTVERETALAWIAAAHVVVHASEAEGMSTVIREAESLGTRVERLV